MLSNVLYVLQFVLMAVFGGFQLAALIGSDKGTSLTWIICWQGFVAMNLLLAMRARAEQPDRENLRLIRVYLGWGAFGVSWFVVMLVRGTISWNYYDTINIAVALIGSAVTVAAARYFGLRGFRQIMGHPWVRASEALLLKSAPQVSMAVQLLSGIPVVVASPTVWAGHATVAIRIVMASRAMYKTGYNRNLMAILISEGGNELTWIIFTAVWLMS